MEKKLKKIFKKVLDAIQKDEEIYNSIFHRDRDRITVIGLCDLIYNHLPEDFPDLFGISESEGRNIRIYFYEIKPEDFICELYREFPGVFKGEKDYM